MIYRNRYIYPSQYDYAGHNQHGDRYKKIGNPQTTATALSAALDNASDLAQLIYLSSKLGIPITWRADTTPQTAEIEVVSVNALRTLGII